MTPDIEQSLHESYHDEEETIQRDRSILARYEEARQLYAVSRTGLSAEQWARLVAGEILNSEGEGEGGAGFLDELEKGRLEEEAREYFRDFGKKDEDPEEEVDAGTVDASEDEDEVDEDDDEQLRLSDDDEVNSVESRSTTTLSAPQTSIGGTDTNSSRFSDDSIIAPAPPVPKTVKGTEVLNQLIFSYVRQPRDEQLPEQYSSKWVEILKEFGYEGLIDEALLKEPVLRTLVHGKRQIMHNILSSISRKLLLSMISGDLPELIANKDPEITAEHKRVKEQSAHAPGCYTHFLVDEHGLSPTVEELETMVWYMRQYNHYGPGMHHSTGNKQLWYAIDKIKHANTPDDTSRPNGFREYLQTDTTGNGFSDAQQVCVDTFLNELEYRLSKYSNKLSTIKPSITETGYAIDCEARLKQHRKHTKSNYIMNLAEAIFQYMYDDFQIDRLVKNYQFYIYNCWEVEQCYISEIVLSRILGSYIYNGGGFSHHPAGQNNITGWKNRPTWEFWYKLTDYAIKSTPWVRNLKWDRSRTRYRLARQQKKRDTQLLDKKRDARRKGESSMKELVAEQRKRCQQAETDARDAVDQRIKEAMSESIRKQVRDAGPILNEIAEINLELASAQGLIGDALAAIEGEDVSENDNFDLDDLDKAVVSGEEETDD
ncbi:hypothetical protein FKW77_000981 [Venturia effusa]|uniref:Uncharacterized protein n=1 Tax=Venturia effusa TaxID=50376 RepID=A0A517L4T1_9PEZI|nr:hypothetical protein FKW77_000981 [Venturia effusa]